MTVTIKNWFFRLGGAAGAVFGHADFPDGHRIGTSRIVAVAWADDVPTVRTSTGSRYKLVDPVCNPLQLEQLRNLPIEDAPDKQEGGAP